MAIYRGAGGAGDSDTDAYASEIAGYAQTATTKATEASVSAAQAATSAAAAASSAAGVGADADAAAASASSAATSATAAASSASSAANSLSQITDLSASATTLSEGSSATASYSAVTGVLSLGIPVGATGATGATGPAGADGAAGADGDSITSVTSSKTGSTTTVTISGTFTGSPYNFDIEDGADGTGAGDLISTNNLSDLANIATARTNLGLGTAATTASTDYATAAQGALADTALQSYTETDPVFVASPAYGITSINITNWNTAYGWGDHSTVGYLTSYTETDPVFTASAASGITSTNISNWNTAYGWGDHSTAGYLTSYTETDPVFVASAAYGITSTNISNWNTAYGGSFTNVTATGYVDATYYTEGVYNLTGTAIDPANGSVQYKTLAANTTFTESLADGDSVTLRIAGGATYTVTWPTMTWVTSAGNTAPTLTAGDVVVLWQEGTTVYGAYVGSYV